MSDGDVAGAAVRAEVAEGGVPSAGNARVVEDTARSLPTDGTPAPSRHRIPVRILGTGAHLPERIVDNREVARLCGVDAEWIERRTGILERRRAPDGQATSDLGALAAESALLDAGLTSGDVDLVICTTCSPDHSFPSTASIIAQTIGASGYAAFDLEAGCAGFIYACVIAAQQVAMGLAQVALVVGSDVMSRLVDPSDASTAPLFGDGAGAVLFGRSHDERGFEAVSLGADGSGAGLLSLPAGGSRLPCSPGTLARGEHFVRMSGLALYRRGIRHTAEAAASVMGACGITPDDIDLVVPHQSSRRLLTAAAGACGFAMETVVMNLQRFGNTSCASVPIALNEACRDGRVQRGQNVLLLGFGAGLSWAAGLLRV